MAVTIVGEPGAPDASLQGAEQAPEPLREAVAILWSQRLAEEVSSGSERAMLVEAQYNSDSSMLISEPSRLSMEKTAGGAARRSLSRGGFYVNRRFAIAAAERIGKDPAEPPAGSGMKLGKKYTAASLLHARMLSERSALTITLCRTVNEDGVEARVVVSTVLVDGALLDTGIPGPSAEQMNAEGSTSWRIVHEDVLTHGAIGNVPVTSMPAVAPDPAPEAGFEGDGFVEASWEAEAYNWIAGVKGAYFAAADAGSAAAVADKDFAEDCSLLACHPGFGSDERSPEMELALGKSHCAQCYCSKYWAAAGEQGVIHQKVELAREVLPGELALILLWITVDEPGGRTRSFVTESGLAAKGGDGEWRRVHSTLHAVRRHVMREETSPKL